MVGQVGSPENEAVASLEGLLVQVERGRYGPPHRAAAELVTVDPQMRSHTVETVESWRRMMLSSVEKERGWRGRLWPVSLVRSQGPR